MTGFGLRGIDGVFTAYVGKIVLSRFLLLLVLISLIWQMLDLLNYSDDVLAAPGATPLSLLRYVGYALPQIVSQFIPFAALLAIVFSLTSLALTSEITVMRAAGMSANKVLFPVGLVCGGIAVCHFAFQELIAVEAADRLNYWRANNYATSLPPGDSVRTDIRLTFEDDIIEAVSANRDKGITTLNDVTVYERVGALTREVLRARSATFQNGQWTFNQVNRGSARDQSVVFSDSLRWDANFSPDFLFALSLEPDRTSLSELWTKIDQLKRDNADYRSEMTSFLSRFSRPLATLIMPLLGAMAGFGAHRSGVMLARAINGSILGFGYFVVENISLALGKLGVLPASLGAFFPLALFMVIGFTIVVSMESK
ncbi:MAG: LPS export ABC transporter permease LptG [Pseudomonadota bacterium]